MSAVSERSNAEGSEGEKGKQQHGCGVVLNLGTAELGDTAKDGSSSGCSGSALLAVHERVESEGETVGWRGETVRARVCF